jgi:hypothetical protein
VDLIANISVLDDAPALVERWLAYYRRCGVDRFHVFLNQDRSCEDRWQALRPLLGAPDVTVAAVSEGVEDEQRRVDRFSDYCAAELGRQPFVLAADSDEFISRPRAAAELLVASSYDFVPGMLVDRFALAGQVAPIDGVPDLPSAFPLCTHFTWGALGGLVSKVPVSRPGLRFRTGLHGVEGQEQLRAPPWWIPVDHFKWHAGVIERIRARLARGWGGEPYLRECRAFLDRFVLDDGRIDLTGVACWLRPEW